MCEYTETDDGQLSFFEDPSNDDFSQETSEIPEDTCESIDDGQLDGQITFFEEEVRSDTQSDLEKVNHPDMTLEEVQELQGVKENENGNLETTGDGTGNEAFTDSLPEDYEQSGDRIEPGATMSHDEFIAEQDRFEADVNGSVRAKMAGMPDNEDIDNDDNQNVISRKIER